jgi:Na+-transporting methylmalonyl-CoA/oxaloacetate decarboxylase gamma subunit
MLNLVAAASTVKGEMLGLGTAFVDALLGYLVVFIGLILLMWVIQIVGRIMVAKTEKEKAAKAAAAAAAPAPAPAPEKPKELAPGSAGEVKLYDTDPRDAAMIMSIVADKLQKPLNELRFVSIKEVK